MNFIKHLNIGQLGEDLVTQWLQSRGWVILQRRFSCRWGEIDIIAEDNGETGELKGKLSNIVFVEVKTRSSGNWDAGGKNAIALQKQTKLWRTAEMFLAQYPEKADYPCRFDVALVFCQQISQNLTGVTVTQEALDTLSVSGYQFKLQEYIPAAFDSLY